MLREKPPLTSVRIRGMILAWKVMAKVFFAARASAAPPEPGGALSLLSGHVRALRSGARDGIIGAITGKGDDGMHLIFYLYGKTAVLVILGAFALGFGIGFLVGKRK